MDISGGGNEHVFPRSSPFPYPPHIGTISDQYFRQQRPDIWFAAPTARSNGGARNHCCANGVCNLCPVDAKFSIMNGISAFERPNARLVLGAEVTAVHIEGGQAKGVEVVTGEGRRVELRADTVALGANALHNAAILMRSDIKSAALGRYIHEQIAQEVSVNIPIKNYYGGTSITGHCYGLYDGAHRRENGAVLIENYNAPSHIRTEIGKWTQRLHLKFIVEDLPQAQNRVVLTEAGAPRILWAGHSEYAFKGLEFARENLASVMPVEVEALHAHSINATEAHIQGTHRMGTDPQTSVVDPYLRTHSAQNLFALGAGAFPSCSPANPTLTLSALSLRAGGGVVMNMNRRTLLFTMGGAGVAGAGLLVATGMHSVVHHLIARNFGTDIAATEDAKAFADDFVARVKSSAPPVAFYLGGAHLSLAAKLSGDVQNADALEQAMITDFVLSTNVAQVYPVADEFSYSGLFDPYEGTCVNQLSAAYLL